MSGVASADVGLWLSLELHDDVLDQAVLAYLPLIVIDQWCEGTVAACGSEWGKQGLLRSFCSCQFVPGRSFLIPTPLLLQHGS